MITRPYVGQKVCGVSGVENYVFVKSNEGLIGEIVGIDYFTNTVDVKLQDGELLHIGILALEDREMKSSFIRPVIDWISGIS